MNLFSIVSQIGMHFRLIIYKKNRNQIQINLLDRFRFGHTCSVLPSLPVAAPGSTATPAWVVPERIEYRGLQGDVVYLG
jgi:hypothetical protein